MISYSRILNGSMRTCSGNGSHEKHDTNTIYKARFHVADRDGAQLKINGEMRSSEKNKEGDCS